MKGLYKFCSVTTIFLIAASLVAAGALVASTILGVAGSAWLLWYFSMYSTFAAIVMAITTTLVFLVGYYKETEEKACGIAHATDPKAHVIYS